MSDATDELPDDLASALALLAEERARRIAAEAEAATAKAQAASAKALVSHSEALIARLKLEIEKVRRELYGSRSERKARLLEQMELQLEELEADAGEDELAAEVAAKASTVRAFERSLSTLADQVGACAAALKPLHSLVEAHVLAAERLHGDDTTMPILAKGKTDTGRIWTYVRDDRPFGGQSPPAALYYASRDRRQEHPERHLKTFTGILQADAYGGYNPLFKVDRDPGPLTQALCWSHARRKFFVLADIATNAKRGSRAAPISPMALEAVKRIDALFDIEREINGLAAAERLERRRKHSLPLVGELHRWLQTERAKLSRSSPVAEPIDYMLKRWNGFVSFLDDGRICLTNNAAERALRGFALGRKSWLFAGSDRGADRAALIVTLIMSAKLNDIDPQAWLADVLARIADTPISKLEQLLPWNWQPHGLNAQAA
ncbi:IS66 family transposase [Rhizobium leguminosarum]|nr:IS66 family transposase [Rhizobium leguminosarum]